MITRAGNGDSTPEVILTAPVDGAYFLKAVATLGIVSGTGPGTPELNVDIYASDPVNASPGASQMHIERHTSGAYATDPRGIIFLRKGCTLTLTALTRNGVTDASWSLDLSMHLLGGPDLLS